MTTTLYAIAPNALTGSAFEVKGPLPAVLLEAGFQHVTPGKCYRKTVRCPVNGDGYWYTRQELVTADGRVMGSIPRYDMASGEL